MNSSAFTRDKAAVDSCLKRAGDALIAIKPLKMHVPERYQEHDLATFEDVIVVLGYMCLITEDNRFASSAISAMMRTEPDTINPVVVDGVNYVELGYEPGSAVIANVHLVKVDNLAHKIYTELTSKGRIPWFYDYEGVQRLYDSVQKHCGIRMGADPAIRNLLASSICRDSKDPTYFYRQVVQSKAELVSNPPLVIPQRNISYGATNVTAKLSGSYFDEGMTSSLINSSDRVERVESMLRQ